MKNFISLTDLNKQEIYKIFTIADEAAQGKYRSILKDKTVVMFFPNSSIRTRITFEKGISLLGGQTVLFPSETLDKKEDLRDVCGYLNNWADMIIVRHKSNEMIKRLADYSIVPVINAMTDVDHPCEIMTDLYSLSKRRVDFTKDKYLFCGKCGNIGFTWKEASEIMGFELAQCCGKGYEIPDLNVYYDINEAVKGRDIICTDSLPTDILADFRECQVTRSVMYKANKGAILNPCPPFYRGEEVSDDLIASGYFVGYEFKKSLLEVQQAIMIYCLKEG